MKTSYRTRRKQAHGAKRHSLSASARRQSGRTHSKSRLAATRALALPALTTPPRHILVPIDFSAESTRALKSAVQLASRYGAAVTLVHVVEPITYIYDCGYGPVRRWRPNETLIRDAQQRLHVLSLRHVDSTLSCKVVVKNGRAFDEIAKSAKELGADLIVMPTRGFTDPRSGEIGSTAERVVRHAPCPVLTVRKPVLLGKRSKSQICDYNQTKNQIAGYETESQFDPSQGVR